ncbi:hypothetical protein CRN77_15360 [Proteus vulgaris]|nr:hypothetical protein CRN77_15360 [Proteus vulgaris]
MDNSSSNFKISQDYELASLEKKQAYPIPKDDWDYLKLKMDSVRDDANLYHTIGSVLLGISGSALITALTLKVDPDASIKTIAWSVCICTAICGGLSCFFGSKQRKVQRVGIDDILAQMDLIESRYNSIEKNRIL